VLRATLQSWSPVVVGWFRDDPSAAFGPDRFALFEVADCRALDADRCGPKKAPEFPAATQATS
jgi:hypothetical protein